MTTIKVPKSDVLRSVVPGHVWRTRAFKFKPVSFVVESDSLKDRIIDDDIQEESLLRWQKDPTLPVLYSVSGSPDDSKAKLFAAYLAYGHLAKLGVRAHIEWVTLFGGWDQPKVVTGNTKPTLLIISNLTIDSTAFRIERARDLLEMFPDIPRIVISCGTDPISFCSMKLRVPVHSLAYFLESQVRTKVSVI